MVEAALGFTFSGKGGHKMVHKPLVPCIKMARKLLPVQIFFFCQLSDYGQSNWQMFIAGTCQPICLKETKHLFFTGR